LAETLDVLTRVRIPEWMDAQLVVADNGSEDETAAVVQNRTIWQRPIKYLYVNKTGKGSALNQAIAVAAGDVFAFIDDDVHPTEGWLEALTLPIFEEKLDCVVGRVELAPHLIRDWMEPRHRWVMADTTFLDPENPTSAVGANWAHRASLLASGMKYDEELSADYSAYEDTLFSMQLKESGARFGMSRDALVFHHFDEARLSREAFTRRAINEGRGRAYLEWHWLQVETANPWVKYFKSSFRLKWLQWMHEVHQLPHLPLWELDLIEKVSFYKTYTQLKKSDRVYERRGLRKLRSGTSDAPLGSSSYENA